MSCNACILPTTVLWQYVGRTAHRTFVHITISCKKKKAFKSYTVWKFLTLPCSEYICWSGVKHKGPLMLLLVKKKKIYIVFYMAQEFSSFLNIHRLSH